MPDEQPAALTERHTRPVRRRFRRPNGPIKVTARDDPWAVPKAAQKELCLSHPSLIHEPESTLTRNRSVTRYSRRL
jgi:hypothetical protein